VTEFTVYHTSHSILCPASSPSSGSIVQVDDLSRLCGTHNVRAGLQKHVTTDKDADSTRDVAHAQCGVVWAMLKYNISVFPHHEWRK
jgi:hypothetical protein